MINFRQTRKCIGGYRGLHIVGGTDIVDVMDFTMLDRESGETIGDLHIHIEKNGTIGVWSNSHQIHISKG